MNSTRFLVVLAAALLALTTPEVRGQSSALVTAGSTWRYLDNGSNQGTAWRAPAFDDSTWASGTAQLGYGDGDEATVVSYGSSATAKYVTTYFRRTFTVSNPSAFASLNLRVLRDDGAVVYVNGVEVFRTNMPGGAIANTALATSAVADAAESTFVTADISAAALVAGTNVIAVEVHQADVASSDLSFDLELTGSASASLTRGPYLQSATPSSVVVRWRTSAPVVGRVEYGPSPGAVSGSVEEPSARTEHEVRLSGLVPDTRYYYSIGTPAATLAGDATFHFKTPPAPGSNQPVRVWVIGDSGTADAGAQAVRDSFAAFAGSRPADLWLMLGDNAYNDGLDAEYQRAVFDMYPSMLRQTVLWPTYGNHDGYGSDAATQTGPYFSIFTLPKSGEAGGVASGTEAYYSFDYANIHFVCLESFETDRSPTGPMVTWLQRDLAANTQPWVIAFWHHPPYSKGSHDSDVEVELVQMRQNVLPVLENFGVDLVLTGHSHSYERSFLLDGHYGTSSTLTAAMKKDGGSGRTDGTGAYGKPGSGMSPHEGTVYAVAGVGGKTLAAPLNHPAMYLSQAVLGSMVLDVAGNRLDASFVDSSGARRDYFSIVKGAAGPVPPPTGATPYGGTAATLPGVIEAEHFDEGGAAVAYLDSTPGNKGNVYRATDVDLEVTADTGGGYDVGWTRAGEWLQYTVNVTRDGAYDLRLRLASTGAGGKLHVDVDGVNTTGAVTVPNTGGWQVWQTVTVPNVALKAGTRRLRVVFDAVGSTGGVTNFNRIEAVATSAASPAYGGTPVVLPGTIQAENFDNGGPSVAYVDTTAGNKGGVYRTTDVDIEASADTGGGFDVAWTRAGEWLVYTTDVSASGIYNLELRLASASTGGVVRVEVDGVDVTGDIAVPNTSGWQVWQTTRVEGITLPAGVHRVRLLFAKAGTDGIANVNWLRFIRAS